MCYPGHMTIGVFWLCRDTDMMEQHNCLQNYRHSVDRRDCSIWHFCAFRHTALLLHPFSSVFYYFVFLLVFSFSSSTGLVSQENYLVRLQKKNLVCVPTGSFENIFNFHTLARWRGTLLFKIGYFLSFGANFRWEIGLYVTKKTRNVSQSWQERIFWWRKGHF